MPEDSDKYPTESGRRRFVKGVVGSATLASVGTGAAAAVGTATAPSGAGGGLTTFFAIENTEGPAPRGMPLVPVEVTSDGALEGVWPDQVQDGVAQMDLGGATYSSSWFQYCGVQTYPGVAPSADQDNAFRVASGAGETYSWMSDLNAGDPLTVDMFDDYETWGNDIGRDGLGKPAIASWRSVDVSPQATMVVQVLRSTRIQEIRADPPDGVDAGFLRAATTEEGFIAWLNKCTHFCCVPGFKHIPGSASFGAEDRVYCQCHQSVYDPFSVVSGSFVALPRPEE
ncbi:MAG: ubiquinol-cytochrome c reductase iron-sulfur subunit [Haloarculaceae archaeon]